VRVTNDWVLVVHKPAGGQPAQSYTRLPEGYSVYRILPTNFTVLRCKPYLRLPSVN